MSRESEFKINKKFAERYEKYRQKEELQKLKDRYGDEAADSDSDSESDEDSEVEFDPRLERDFYRTLSLLKKKDPKIYEQDAKFYSAEESSGDSDDQPSTSQKKQKPMFLKDYERKVILERGGKYEDEESEDEEAARRMERDASPSYIQEQRELRESFRKFVEDSDDEGNEEEGGSELLTRRIKTQEEKDKEEVDYLEWLKGQAELEGEAEVQDMKYLRDYWNDPLLDERERFLRDYILNKGYLDEDEEDRIPSYDEIVQDELQDSEEEGESFLEQQEDFERKYNFRFEEPDGNEIKTYPRSIATSVRNKDERRKRKREEVKERKRKEKEQRQAQLKQLKNLKRREIIEKLQRLQDLTGNKQLAFSQGDLEGDFDPQEHDRLMQKFFGDEYYGEGEEEKPQFDDEEDLDGHWNWDTWTGEEGEVNEGESEGEDGQYENYQPSCEDPDFIMDADFDPSQQPTSSKKKKRREKEEKRKKVKKEDDAPLMGKKRRKSHFTEVITKSKPVFDPQEKSFEQYLDEYYRLDFEDIIDDLPCRFRYRQVVPNDFGLSTEEILGAEEKELNRWCSLRKTCMFRSEKEELSDLKNYKMKGSNEKKKKEILGSLYAADEEQEEQAMGKTKVGKKRRDRLKKKGVEVKEREDAGTEEDSAEGKLVESLREAGDEEEEAEEFLIPKKKLKQETEPVEDAQSVRTKEGAKWPKKKRRHLGGRLLPGSFRVKMGGREFSGQRLKAYGLNPKRLHHRQLNRQKRKEQEKREKGKAKN
ncbi:hypothetical protein GJAV_G00143910 [Gymnothorax javanicus]|nr:hypothetical protein GJAV_G00143910 [Gymnothorax javanicus]